MNSGIEDFGFLVELISPLLRDTTLGLEDIA